MCDSKHNVLKIAYLQQNHDIQSCSVAKSRPTLYDPKTSTPGLPVLHSQSSLKFKPMESVLPSNHLILCHTLLLPSIFPSIRVFSNELALPIRWPKYWSFSLSPFNVVRVDFFKIDWFDLLEVQGTLKSLRRHHSSKTSIIWCSAFFMVPSWTTALSWGRGLDNSTKL